MELILSQTAAYAASILVGAAQQAVKSLEYTAITIQLIAETIANGVKEFYSDLGNRLSLHGAMSG